MRVREDGVRFFNAVALCIGVEVAFGFLVAAVIVAVS